MCDLEFDRNSGCLSPGDASISAPDSRERTRGWAPDRDTATGDAQDLRYGVGQPSELGQPHVVVSGIPGRGYHQHWTRDLVFNPGGTKMYLSIGSQSNVAEDPPPRASILEFNPDGSGRRTFASGIRNAVGKAFNPTTGEMWCTCNERDGLGDDLVPDYVTAVRAGDFFGWPWYYIGAHHDPRMPERPDLITKRVKMPDVLIESHSAA